MGRPRPIQRPGKKQLPRRATENPPPSSKRCRIVESDDDDSNSAFGPFMADTTSIAVSLGLVGTKESFSCSWNFDHQQLDEDSAFEPFTTNIAVSLGLVWTKESF
jgi:hypothetical protein